MYLHALFFIKTNPKFDPNAEESGKIWDFRRLNYNMYWLLSNLHSENFEFGPLIIRVPFSNSIK